MGDITPVGMKEFGKLMTLCGRKQKQSVVRILKKAKIQHDKKIINLLYMCYIHCTRKRCHWARNRSCTFFGH